MEVFTHIVCVNALDFVKMVRLFGQRLRADRLVKTGLTVKVDIRSVSGVIPIDGSSVHYFTVLFLIFVVIKRIDRLYRTVLAVVPIDFCQMDARL